MKKDTQNEKKRLKREAILENARNVFSRQGLIDVTMQDIIDECQISRGGLYLYFDSVDAIFMEVVNQRTDRKFDGIRQAVKENVAFDKLLDQYFEEHKERLLHHIGDSMLRAMYEYYYTHQTKEAHQFQQKQLQATKATIYEILKLGVYQEVLVDQQLDEIAENYMFVIEGLGVLALTGGITATQIDHQIAMMKSLLPIINR
ncbi:TetR/AcrR family transcriptional regulator [Enterococcus faecalis]